jgi:putative FmdB family regulatory protein
MPIYEYCCEKCDERFELFVRSFTQRDVPICPTCGSSKVRKAVSLVGVGGLGEDKPSLASCGSAPT